ncbi:MAG: hypothetical protein F6J95_028720 [Leptolyngbya sp. SIO1E4]|nr:hypothetical protein [Leptolyngbya sp. SIO1E4]
MQIQKYRLAIRRLMRQWLKTTANEGGLTLLETLVAIIVIGLTVSAITPAFVLAVATRVQSQKAEQASQLAQDAIDKARVVMELGSVEDLGAGGVAAVREDFLPLDAGDVAATTVGAPSRFLRLDNDSCEGAAAQPASDEACSVDINGDGEADFAVQAYRVNSFAAPSGELAAFDMGVRVYAYDATRDPADDGTADVAVTELNTERASAGITNRARDDRGNGYRFAPLAVVYTTIVRSEEDNSLCEYFENQGVDPVSRGLTCD